MSSKIKFLLTIAVAVLFSCIFAYAIAVQLKTNSTQVPANEPATESEVAEEPVVEILSEYAPEPEPEIEHNTMVLETNTELVDLVVVEEPVTVETTHVDVEIGDNDAYVAEMLELYKMAVVVYDENYVLADEGYDDSVEAVWSRDQTDYEILTSFISQLKVLDSSDGVDHYVINPELKITENTMYYEMLAPYSAKLYVYYDGYTCYGCVVP